jgi:hypothetical protein
MQTMPVTQVYRLALHRQGEHLCLHTSNGKANDPSTEKSKAFALGFNPESTAKSPGFNAKAQSRQDS